MAKRKPKKRQNTPTPKGKSAAAAESGGPETGAEEIPGAELAEWIAKATGEDPGAIRLKIAAAIENGAPNKKGKINPVALAAWLLAEREKGAA